MPKNSIAGYVRSHLAETVEVLNLLDKLCQRESSLELHRFFIRLQNEMGEDPAALKKLLFGLGETEKAERLSVQVRQGMRCLRVLDLGLDLKDPEIFEALEWMALEIQSKTLMWRTLAMVSPKVPAWNTVDFKSFEMRSINQRDRVESVRLEVASVVLRAG